MSNSIKHVGYLLQLKQYQLPGRVLWNAFAKDIHFNTYHPRQQKIMHTFTAFLALFCIFRLAAAQAQINISVESGRNIPEPKIVGMWVEPGDEHLELTKTDEGVYLLKMKEVPGQESGLFQIETTHGCYSFRIPLAFFEQNETHVFRLVSTRKGFKKQYNVIFSRQSSELQTPVFAEFRKSCT